MPLTLEQKTRALQSNGYDPSKFEVDDTGNVFEKPPTSLAQPTVSEAPISPLSGGIQTMPQGDSPLTTFGKSAAISALPSLGAGGGAALASWLLGPEVGLPVSIIAGLTGAIGGGFGARKLQNAILPDSIQKNVAESEQQNPKSALLGSLATMPLGGFNPNLPNVGTAAKGLGKVAVGMFGKGDAGLLPEEARQLLNVALGSGIGAAQPIAESLATQGQMPSLKDILLGAGTGALFNKPNAIGEMFGFKHPELPKTSPDISDVGMIVDNQQQLSTMPQPNIGGILKGGLTQRELELAEAASGKLKNAAYRTDKMAGYRDNPQPDISTFEGEGGALPKQEVEPDIKETLDEINQKLNNFAGLLSKPLGKEALTTGTPVEKVAPKSTNLPGESTTRYSEEPAVKPPLSEEKMPPTHPAVRQLIDKAAVDTADTTIDPNKTPERYKTLLANTDEIQKALTEQVDWSKHPEIKAALENRGFDNLDPDHWQQLSKLHDAILAQPKSEIAAPKTSLPKAQLPEPISKPVVESPKAHVLTNEKGTKIHSVFGEEVSPKDVSNNNLVKRLNVKLQLRPNTPTSEIMAEIQTWPKDVQSAFFKHLAEVKANPTKYSEEPSVSQPETELQKHVNEQLAAKGISGKPTDSWTKIYQDAGILHRNAVVTEDGSIVNKETGKPVAANASFDKALQKWLVKINPSKATIAEAPHELAGHVFLDQLRNSPHARDNEFVSKFERLVEQLPEFKEINEHRIKNGDKPWDTEEFIATQQGLEGVRRNLNLSDESSMKTYMKDLWAHIKTKYGKEGTASEEDYRRLFQYRFQNDPSYHDYFKTGVKLTSPLVTKNSDESHLNEALDDASHADKDWWIINHPKDGLEKFVSNWKKHDPQSFESFKKQGFTDVSAAEEIADNHLHTAAFNAKVPLEEFVNKMRERYSEEPSIRTLKEEQRKTDIARYHALTEEAMAGLKNKQLPSQELLKEIENIKNKYGGAPPDRTDYENLDQKNRSNKTKYSEDSAINYDKYNKEREDRISKIEQYFKDNNLSIRPTEWEKGIAIIGYDKPSSEQKEVKLAELPKEHQDKINEYLPLERQSLIELINKLPKGKLYHDNTLTRNSDESAIRKQPGEGERPAYPFTGKDLSKLPEAERRARQENHDLAHAFEMKDESTGTIKEDEDNLDSSANRTAILHNINNSNASSRNSEDSAIKAKLEDRFINSDKIKTGWMTPYGKVIPANVHEPVGREILEHVHGIKFPEDRHGEVYHELLSKGYLRIVDFKNNEIAVSGKPSTHQLRELKNQAIEQSKSIVDDDTGRFIYKNENENVYDSSKNRYSDEPAIKERSSFLPILTSRFDKIQEKLKSTTGDLVTKGLHSYAGESDYLSGQIGNKLVAALKDYTPEQISRVYRYAHQMDDKGSSSINLTGKEAKLSDEIFSQLRRVREMQNEMGLKVRAGENYRAGGIKPEGYMFNVIDPKVPYEWAEHPNSPESKKYDALYIKHQLDHGVTQENAKELLLDYKKALGNNVAQDIEFGALRKPEGNGLPWELVDQNFSSAAQRYGRRAAHDLAYYKWIQNDPKMRYALSLKDQYGKLPKQEDAPNVDYIGGESAVKDAMRSIFGIDKPRSLTLNASARAVNNTLMGVGTAARNILQMPAFVAQYVQGAQLPLVAKAISNLSESRVRAFESNSIRPNFQDFDAAGYYLGSPNPAIRLLNRYSEVMRKYQGRDMGDRFEGHFYHSLGELLATDNIARAKLGNKESLRFVKRFGDIIEGGGESLLTKKEITQDDISRVAKRFVDATRGTFGPEGLPSGAIEGDLAPFLSLSRWSIEKSNTIWKDVIEPWKQGIYGPALRYVLGSAGVGYLVEQLNELLSNKRGTEPTVNEVWKTGDKKDVIAKAIATMQLAGFSGIIGDGAQLASSMARNKSIKYNSPLSYPLYTWATDTIATNVSQAANAIKEGSDPFEVLGQLAVSMSTQSVQSMRYLDANFIHPEDTKKKERFRDYNIWQEMTDRKEADSSIPTADPYKDIEAKKFKKEEDLQKAGSEIPNLVKKAIEKATVGSFINPEKLKSELAKLKENSYQTMPSPEETPIGFYDYLNHLKRTQGDDKAQKTLVDYLRKREINKVKSEMIPSI